MITYKLYASLRTDKKKTDGTCPINFFLRVEGTIVKIPTGKSCLATEWNKKEHTAKTNSAKGIALAAFLNKRIADFNAFMYSEEAMGKTVTLSLAQSFFDDTNKSDFYAFWTEQVELWGASLKPNTLKTYVTTLRILKEIAPTLSFGDLTLSFVQKFDHHMATKRKNSYNGRFGKHKVLRAMIRRAIANKLMKESPYEHHRLKPAEGQRVFLTLDEVNKIRNYEVNSNGKNLQIAKDYLETSIFLGLRYSDIVGLKYENVKEDHISLVMKKNSKPIIIPLIPMAKAIIDKYSKHKIILDDAPVFPFVANATINKHLKELMRLVGVKKHVSMHVGRHTFASLHLHAKTSLAHLQQLLGHKNIHDTMIYAKTMTEDLFSSMENLNSIYEQSAIHIASGG
ncbi:tyrosine-type recombinase/integrase [Pedobacter helvus]|uniref:Tyrosine-type recombinase/integrase n=1 Tax=Pedobacter helvus TaxID=2563444 RepID=A0ABW9JKR6_9SPHI|nr:site-specific integrase [Pedobacter ureilyticus]